MINRRSAIAMLGVALGLSAHGAFAEAPNGVTVARCCLGDSRRPNLAEPQTEYVGQADRLFIFVLTDSIPSLQRPLWFSEDVEVCASAPLTLVSTTAMTEPIAVAQGNSGPIVVLAVWTVIAEKEAHQQVTVRLSTSGGSHGDCPNRLELARRSELPGQLRQPASTDSGHSIGK